MLNKYSCCALFCSITAPSDFVGTTSCVCFLLPGVISFSRYFFSLKNKLPGRHIFLATRCTSFYLPSALIHIYNSSFIYHQRLPLLKDSDANMSCSPPDALSEGASRYELGVSNLSCDLSSGRNLTDLGDTSGRGAQWNLGAQMSLDTWKARYEQALHSLTPYASVQQYCLVHSATFGLTPLLACPFEVGRIVKLFSSMCVYGLRFAFNHRQNNPGGQNIPCLVPEFWMNCYVKRQH